VSSTCSVAHARVRQLDLGTLEAIRGGHADAARQLVDDSPELAQDVEVEVDGTVADAAAAEIGDERLAETVQQRTAEQDRDAARSGVRVDVGEVRALHVRRVEDQLAVLDALDDAHAVHLEQAAHDAHVADVRHVLQDAGSLAEDGRDHRLGDEVLRALHLDPSAQRLSAVDRDLVDVQADCRPVVPSVFTECVQRMFLQLYACSTGRVRGRQLARSDSNSSIRSTFRRVSPMSSRPSMSRHLV